MRAFVTGATGFLGTNLVRELLAQGWDVVALQRHPSPWLSGLRITAASGNVTDIDSIRSAMPASVDAVFHVAGDTSLWSRGRNQQIRVNVDGTRNVAAVALEKRARRFVQTSSIAAFGRHHGRITEKTESNALDQGTHYGRTKYLGELEVDDAIRCGLDAVFINPPHIVGPYDTGNWSRLIRMVAQETLPGIPPGAASWSHVTEVARAHIAAAEHGRIGHRYLLGGTDASYLEAITIIGTITGKRVPAKPINGTLLRLLGRFTEWASYATGKEPDLTRDGAAMVCETVLSDCSKAVRALGYRPVPLETMLRDCHEWMSSAGMLSVAGP